MSTFMSEHTYVSNTCNPCVDTHCDMCMLTTHADLCVDTYADHICNHSCKPRVNTYVDHTCNYPCEPYTCEFIAKILLSTQ